MSTLDSLTPTLIVILTSILNHNFKENKVLELRDLMCFLMPSIPTLVPIFMGLIKQFSIYPESLGWLGTILICVYNFLMWIITTCQSIFRQHPDFMIETNTETEIETEIKEIEIKIETELSFIQSFVHYLCSHPKTCSHTIKQNYEFEIKDNQYLIQIQEWKNIRIEYHPEATFKLNFLQISFKEDAQGQLILTGYQGIKKQRDYKTFIRLTDFIDDDEERSILQNYIDHDKDVLSKKNEIKIYIDEWDISCKHNRKDFEFSIPKYGYCNLQHMMYLLCKDALPNVDKSLFIVEFCLLISYIGGSNITTIIKTSNLKLFDYNIPLPDSIIKKDGGWDGYTSYKFTFNNSFQLTPFYIKNKHLLPSFKNINFLSTKDPTKDPTKESTKTGLIFHLENKEKLPLFKEFLQTIQQSKPVEGKEGKIKIFNLYLIKKEAQRKLPNPEYQEYENKLLLLEKLKNISDGKEKEKETEKSIAMSSLFSTPIPMKELTEKYLETEVIVKQVNEKYKSWRTLYLREHDMMSLTNILDKFKSGKEYYEEYGLPNKLGILLYGNPGTGKSTTIQAIASYLQKNIYYLNLSCITSNIDLQLLFDHVTTQSLGGGIIVCEDIDAMTDLVHQRTLSTNPNPIIDKDKDKELTLEYFLNLLQGSLTRDGTIFIATTNYINKLDTAFCRIGRFDIKIEMKSCDHYQIQQIFHRFFHRQISSEILLKIPENQFTPAEIIFHFVNGIYTHDTPDSEIMSPFHGAPSEATE
jgi:hypothetical protein